MRTRSPPTAADAGVNRFLLPAGLADEIAEGVMLGGRGFDRLGEWLCPLREWAYPGDQRDPGPFLHFAQEAGEIDAERGGDPPTGFELGNRTCASS